jgi:L-lactate dehydrogenase (cytochrome)
LPRAIHGYVAHGSETETTLRTNRAVFDSWRFVTRNLIGVTERDQSINLLGHCYASPFGIAPMDGSALVAYDGHAVMARAAAEANIPFILSANSIIALEEIARINPNTWFAAYQSPNADAIKGMVERVSGAGIRVLALTTDVPVGSNREADVRAGFGFPIRPNPRLIWDIVAHPRWMAGVLGRTLLRRGYPHIANLEPDGGPGLFSTKVQGIAAHAGLSWEHVRIMREMWKGRFVLKGLLSSADVALARELGVDGVILSNHGGRQLDYAASPVQVLSAAITEARGMTVMIDSGFRRGTDILKAMALGAECVFIGRPFLFAAAFASLGGVQHAISLLSKELDRDMAMLGLHCMNEMRSELLVAAPDAA